MKNNLTDSIYKAWRTGILPLVTALLLLTGCEMDSDMDLPLNVDSNKYTLTSDAGSTQVRIYSTGEWSVRLSENVEWASINRLNGSGNTPVLFKYGANYGVPRAVDIIFTRGGLEQAVRMTQEGENPILSLEESRIEIFSNPWDLRIGLDNNLREDYKQIRDTIVYSVIPDEDDDETPEPDDSVADYTAKIIYTASVSIETTEFDKAVAALENQVQKIGGFVESSNVTGDTQYNSDGTTTVVNRWAYYTVRIPCDHFESFLHETEGFGNVTSTSRDAQNVTSAYTDYEARLSSLNTQEERLLDMLAKSEDVETLIALEQRLSDVRYEIESIERNLRNYDMQIKYSTVNLDLREVEVYTPTVPVRRTFGQKLADSLSDGWNGFTRGIQNVILGLASALPALILLAVITAAVIVCIKKARKKRKAKKAAQDPTPPQDPQ